jgi:hypothetical protein
MSGTAYEPHRFIRPQSKAAIGAPLVLFAVLHRRIEDYRYMLTTVFMKLDFTDYVPEETIGTRLLIYHWELSNT